MTDEVASVHGDDDRVSARLDGFWDEYVRGDGVAVDRLICKVVNIESGELVFDRCDCGRIHARFGNNARLCDDCDRCPISCSRTGGWQTNFQNIDVG